MPRGRPPKPRPAEPSEARPLAGIPQAPRSLSKFQRKVWRELIRVLAPSGLLTQADVWVMTQMCRAVETAEESAAWCAAAPEAEWGKVPPTAESVTGKMRTGKTGGAYQTPWLAILRHAEEQVLRLSSLLGLDPASRTRLRVTIEPKLMDEPDNTERFFAAREKAKGG